MDLENSTAPETVQSGESAEVVAQQTETPTEAAGQKSVVGSYRNADFDMVDADSGETDAADETPAADPGGAGQERSTTQTREENAAIRAARIRAARDAEAAAKARAAAETDEAISQSGVINPYTGKPFTSMKEFREYGEKTRKAELVQQAKKTGKTVEELTEDERDRAFVRAERKAREVSEAVDAQKATQQKFVAEDVINFIEAHPEFDEQKLQELEKNQNFREFCGSRFGREPLAKLYDSYVKLVGAAGTAAVTRAADRRARSTGSGTGGGAVLSPAQKAVLDQWNEDHPEMAMTAKEFLGR